MHDQEANLKASPNLGPQNYYMETEAKPLESEPDVDGNDPLNFPPRTQNKRVSDFVI